MKKAIALLILGVLMLSLCACSPAKFNGSRTGNDTQLVMTYTVFNTTDSQLLTLEEGDWLQVDIVRESGKLSLEIQKDGSEAVYKSAELPTSSFQVGIPESGTYKVTVTGENAKGNLSVVKIVESPQ